MKYILDFIKYGIKGLLLFWCPFGRAGRKEYGCFVLLVFVAALLVFLLAPEYMARFNIAADFKTVLLFIWILENAAIRRGHDLGYNAGYTVLHNLKGSGFVARLFQEKGSCLPNEYGPAPEENE